MNWNIVLAILLIGGAIIMAILTDGVLLPISLPVAVYGLQKLGIQP